MMIGIILTILGGALWGTNATVSKILMSQYRVSPLQIACVRQLAAGVLFVIVASIGNRKQRVGALSTKKSWPMLVVTGIVCVLLTQVAYLFTIVGGTFGAYWMFLAGVMRVGSVRGTLLGASEPVMAAITAVVFTGAVFSWADFAGFALIFIMMILLR